MMKTALQVYLEHEYGFNLDDPRNLKQELLKLWQKDPQKFADLITELKRLGDRIATEKGFTIRYRDIKPISDLKPKRELSVEEAIKLQNELPKKLVDRLLKEGNSIGFMIASKARGKPNQAMQMLVSPILFSDARNKPFPFTIKRAFSEGLRPEEYFASSVGARKGIVSTQLATSEPGALSKELLANVAHLTVTEVDCGTTKGLKFPVDSDFVLDRYLAHDHGKYKRNTLVTPEIRDSMKKDGIKEVEVRTPLTCQAKDGVCSYCLGPVGDRKLPEVGFNAGVVLGQTITEPLTQFVLSFKHTGGLANVSRGGAFEQVRRLFHMPKNFAGKAVLAEVSGKVEKIEKSPLGGWYVYIKGKRHYIPSSSKPTVQVGDTVEKGDIISEGIASPQEIAKKKGLFEARQYIAQALHNIYKAQGIDIHPKAFETVARALTKYVRVVDPGSTDLVKGEVFDVDGLRKILGDKIKSVPRRQAKGKVLARDYGKYPVGTVVTKDMLKDLPQTVEVIDADVKLEPEIPPLQKAHLYTSDWLVGMSRSELKRVLLEGAWYGKTSKFKWYHPIPRWIMGTFQEG